METAKNAPSEYGEHPIERIMDGAFGKVRTLTDADIIVGDPIVTADGTSIIPISKVSVGVVSGGGEYGTDKTDNSFAGASGAGMSISPMCFLVADGKSVKVLTMDSKGPFDKVMDTVPNLIGALIGKKKK